MALLLRLGLGILFVIEANFRARNRLAIGIDHVTADWHSPFQTEGVVRWNDFTAVRPPEQTRVGETFEAGREFKQSGGGSRKRDVANTVTPRTEGRLVKTRAFQHRSSASTPDTGLLVSAARIVSRSASAFAGSALVVAALAPAVRRAGLYPMWR